MKKSKPNPFATNKAAGKGKMAPPFGKGKGDDEGKKPGKKGKLPPWLKGKK